MTITDPRLAREKTRVPRRSDYEKRPVLSATIHPDIKKTLVSMSERTGMSISQVTDEVLYTGLRCRSCLNLMSEWRGESTGPAHRYIK